MPPSPRWGVWAGQGAAVVMACLALVWWGSLCLDASQGRTGWWPVMLAAGVLVAWGMPVHRWAKGLRPQSERCVYWHPPTLRQAVGAPSRQRTPVRWTDEASRPLHLHVEMDLGAGALVRVQPIDALTDRRAGADQWRWIGAQALAGPWRWRLMSASRLSPVPVDEREPEQAMVASWALTTSQKETLLKAPRRSA